MMKLRTLSARAGILTLAAMSSACASLSFLAANIPASFGAYQRTTDIPYGPDRRQRLDVFVPKPANGAEQGAASSQGARPVVIFWYGGSWQMGSKSEYKFVGAALAERGFVTVLPDYRLYPQVKFPEFLDDAAKAVVWVQQHAQEYGGDPRHIVLMGHSAGAYTAAYLALNREFLIKTGVKPEGIAGLVGLSGPYALAPNTRVLHTIFGKPFTESDWQPIRFVTRQAPPAFLAQGLSDTLVSSRQTEQLRDALRANGVRVEAELYAGRGHADTVAAISIPARHRAPVLDDAAKFIESVAAVAPVGTSAPLQKPSIAGRLGSASPSQPPGD